MRGKTRWTCAPIYFPWCQSIDCPLLKWTGKSAPQQTLTLVKVGAHASLKEGLDPVTNLMGKVDSDIWTSMLDQIIAHELQAGKCKTQSICREGMYWWSQDPGFRPGGMREC